MRHHRLVRQLPNLLSGGRLLAGPVLIALALIHAEKAFSWLLIGALISDIADGLLARALKLQTKLGAMLDSAADVMTLACAAFGIQVFRPGLFEQHTLGCAAVLGGWAVVCAVALLRYRKLSSFHTYTSKAAGYALGLFLAVLFVWGFAAPLFYLAVCLSVISSAEELALLWQLPLWQSDVRGLWWVLRARRTALRAEG